jgi:hypothetical protein
MVKSNLNINEKNESLGKFCWGEVGKGEKVLLLFLPLAIKQCDALPSSLIDSNVSLKWK